jgi:hypothetical protein
VVAPASRGGRLSETLDRLRLAELRPGEATIGLATNAARVEALKSQGFRQLREVPSELTGGSCMVMLWPGEGVEEERQSPPNMAVPRC